MESIFDRQKVLVTSAAYANEDIKSRITSLQNEILRFKRSTEFYKHNELQIRASIDEIHARKMPNHPEYTSSSTRNPARTSPVFVHMTREQIRHLDRPVSIRELVRRLVIPL